MRGFLLALLLVSLSGCSSTNPAMPPSDDPGDSSGPDGGDHQEAGADAPASPPPLVRKEVTWLAELTEVRAGNSYHKSAQEGSSCFLIEVADGAVARGGNLTATWSAQSTLAATLRLVVAKENEEAVEDQAGTTGLGYAFALSPAQDTIRVYLGVPTPGAAYDQPVDMMLVLEVEGDAEVTARPFGICNPA